MSGAFSSTHWGKRGTTPPWRPWARVGCLRAVKMYAALAGTSRSHFRRRLRPGWRDNSGWATCAGRNGGPSLTASYEVRTTELPKRIICRWPSRKAAQHWSRRCEMLPCDVHEVLATSVDRLAQPGPASFRGPAAFDLLVHWPDLSVNSQRCLHNAVVPHQADHRQSVVPGFPVQRSWDPESVRCRVGQMPGQSCEVNQDVR